MMGKWQYFLSSSVLVTSLLLSGCFDKQAPDKEQTKVNTDKPAKTEISVKDISIKDSAITELMNQLYGKDQFWAKHKCWLKIIVVEGETQTFCMQPLGAKEVSIGQEKKWYVQTTGNFKNDNPDEKDDFASYHAAPGAFGAFIIQPDSTDNNKVIASLPAETIGSWGNGPGEPYTLVQLSKQGDFGWLGETSYTNQGYTVSSLSLFAAIGNEIKDINGNIPDSSDNSGYDEQNYEKVTYLYSFEEDKEHNGFYPIHISERTEKDGKKLEERSFKAYFDPNKKVYTCSDKSCTNNKGM